MKKNKPLLSIGITTYNREKMLRETVNSVLTQDFADFEVLIANDNPSRKVDKEMLGVSDRRVKIFNHSKNLGEEKNMNFLLENSCGDYFSWLADDDAYLPGFFGKVKLAFEQSPQAKLVYSDFQSGNEFEISEPREKTNIKVYEGEEFLNRYLKRELTLIAVYGLFERNYLNAQGGIRKLGSGYGPYSDVLLALNAGKLEKIVYIEEKLVFFRTHDDSLSATSSDMETFVSAQKALVLSAKKIFRDKKLDKSFNENYYYLLIWLIRDIGEVAKRSGGRVQTKAFSQWAWLLFSGVVNIPELKKWIWLVWIVKLQIMKYLKKHRSQID